MIPRSDRYDRQTAIFGIEGQIKIQSTKVVLVGYGGLGTFVLPQICLLGVRNISVIEHERFSATNRNRYLGFLDSDFNPEAGIGIDVSRQKIWDKIARKLRETFMYYSLVSLIHTVS